MSGTKLTGAEARLASEFAGVFSRETVGELLREIDVEPSNLSQQLAVLRRAGLVATRKEGSTVHYALVSPQIAELMGVARSILTSVLTEQQDLLKTLRSDARTTRRERVRRGAR